MPRIKNFLYLFPTMVGGGSGNFLEENFLVFKKNQNVISDQDNKTFPQAQETGHLIICLDNPLLCLFSDLHMSGIKIRHPLTVYLYHHHISYDPTPSKLAEDGVTTYTISANSI